MGAALGPRDSPRDDVLRQPTALAPSPRNAGVRPLPPLVLQAGHVGEVVVGDQPVVQRDGFREGDDAVVLFVVIAVADPARSPLDLARGFGMWSRPGSFQAVRSIGRGARSTSRLARFATRRPISRELRAPHPETRAATGIVSCTSPR